MEYRTFKVIFFITLALAITGFIMPMALSDITLPAIVSGTITVNNVGTDGVSVSGGGGSDTTHDGGRYAFSVTPDTSIKITASYNGHSVSSGSITVKSGDSSTQNLNINIATATPTPTATPKPSSIATPTSTASKTPTSNPTSTPNNPPPGPVNTWTPPPDATYYPTQTPLLKPTPSPTVMPTVNASITQEINATPSVSTSPVNADDQPGDLSKVNDTSSGKSNIITPTIAPKTEKTRSPGFEGILLLIAFSVVAYIFAIRGDHLKKR